jgi:hypothetical protein
MNIKFKEISGIFESYGMMFSGMELHWYETAWKALEKEGLTSFEDIRDKTAILIRPFTLIMMFREFCRLAAGGSLSYDFENWEEISGINPDELKKMSDEVSDAGGKSDLFLKLVENERSMVFEALIKNVFRGGVNTLFVCMYLACFGAAEGESNGGAIIDKNCFSDEYEGNSDCTELDEEYHKNEGSDELDEGYHTRPMFDSRKTEIRDEINLDESSTKTSSEQFENDFKKYYSEILKDENIIGTGAYDWLSVGTYSLENDEN